MSPYANIDGEKKAIGPRLNDCCAATRARAAVTSSAVLTSLRIKNFKRLEDVDIELGKTVVFVGPNNSGKTTTLQALALWEISLRKWVEKRSGKGPPRSVRALPSTGET
jgi:ABC-type microcin C transport system duplicated ATPase subunit YejF